MLPEAVAAGGMPHAAIMAVLRNSNGLMATGLRVAMLPEAVAAGGMLHAAIMVVLRNSNDLMVVVVTPQGAVAAMLHGVVLEVVLLMGVLNADRVRVVTEARNVADPDPAVDSGVPTMSARYLFRRMCWLKLRNVIKPPCHCPTRIFTTKLVKKLI